MIRFERAHGPRPHSCYISICNYSLLTILLFSHPCTHCTLVHICAVRLRLGRHGQLSRPSPTLVPIRISIPRVIRDLSSHLLGFPHSPPSPSRSSVSGNPTLAIHDKGKKRKKSRAVSSSSTLHSPRQRKILLAVLSPY